MNEKQVLINSIHVYKGLIWIHPDIIKRFKYINFDISLLFYP